MKQNNTNAAEGASLSNAELERLAFEGWFSDGNATCKSIERNGDSYRLMAAHQAWKTWQARASVQVVAGEYICAKCGLRQALGMKADCAF